MSALLSAFAQLAVIGSGLPQPSLSVKPPTTAAALSTYGAPNVEPPTRPAIAPTAAAGSTILGAQSQVTQPFKMSPPADTLWQPLDRDFEREHRRFVGLASASASAFALGIGLQVAALGILRHESCAYEWTGGGDRCRYQCGIGPGGGRRSFLGARQRLSSQLGRVAGVGQTSGGSSVLAGGRRRVDDRDVLIAASAQQDAW
jgi:hypothetical protein